MKNQRDKIEKLFKTARDIDNSTEEVWTMKDGKEILVGEMTESHAKNALRMILGKDRRRREGMEELRKGVVAIDNPNEAKFE